MRLSAEDANERRSTNTHLHLMEAYTNLYRTWPDESLHERLDMALVELFLGTIIADGAGHVRGFFTEDWTPRSTVIPYGHDIQTNWLLLEAADVLGDPCLRDRVRTVSVRVATQVLAQGVDDDGGVFTTNGPDGLDTDKEWWPQAEAIVGFVCAYEETGTEAFLDAAHATWAFVKRHVLDQEHGEWYRRVSREGVLRPGHEKVGPWKCPYHNARACLELIARVEALSGSTPPSSS